MKHKIPFFFASLMLSTLACEQTDTNADANLHSAFSSSSSSGGGSTFLAVAPYTLHGVRIVKTCSEPDPSGGGVAGGEFVELFNVNNPACGGDVDISGWRLALNSSYLTGDFVFPPGTVVRAQRYLVVDFANGLASAQLLPDYDTDVVIATQATTGHPFLNNFFQNTGNNGVSDFLILADDLNSVVDCVGWSSSPSNLSTGPALSLATSQGQWQDGDYVPTWGGLVDVGVYRWFPDAADINSAQGPGGVELWGKGVITPPGTDHYWFDAVTGVRTFEEEIIAGRVVDTQGTQYPGDPIVGATVSLFDPLTSQQLDVATTNPDGYYEFYGYPDGSFNILAQATGYLDTWVGLADKSPHEAAFVEIQTQPIIASNTTTATIGPMGGWINDSQGRFAVFFPADFLTTPTALSVTWRSYGEQSFTLGSQQYQTDDASGGLFYAVESLGAIAIEPHIPPPVNPNLKADVYLKYDISGIPSAGIPAVGDQILAETVNPDGSVEALLGGSFVLNPTNGDLVSHQPVRHFSEIAVYHRITINGDPALLGLGALTTDSNGDGVTDIFDSPTLWRVYTLCPGGRATYTASAWADVRQSTGSNWEVNGSFTASTGGVLAALIGKGKVSGGGKKGGSSSSSTGYGTDFSEGISVEYSLSPTTPPDEQDWTISVNYQMWEVWTKAATNFCTADARPMQGCPPNMRIYVPVGIAAKSSRGAGHCP